MMLKKQTRKGLLSEIEAAKELILAVVQGGPGALYSNQTLSPELTVNDVSRTLTTPIKTIVDIACPKERVRIGNR
jgi:hypothetical protein